MYGLDIELLKSLQLEDMIDSGTGSDNKDFHGKFSLSNSTNAVSDIAERLN